MDQEPTGESLKSKKLSSSAKGFKISPPKDSSEEMSRGVVVSILFHIAIFGFFISHSLISDPKALDLSQAVRVDMVGLPDKLDPNHLPEKPEAHAPPPTQLPEKIEAQPQPPPPPPQKPPVEPSPPTEVKPVETAKPLPTKKEADAINLQKTKKKQQEALKKLKEMSAIDKIKADIEKEKKSQPGLIKGHIISPGTELTGLDKIQNDDYVNALDKHIKQHWALPEWLSRKNLKAVAKFYLDENGQVIRREIVKSSGNPSFDEMTLETIDASNPFPKPPEKLSAKVRVDGVSLGFGE